MTRASNHETTTKKEAFGRKEVCKATGKLATNWLLLAGVRKSISKRSTESSHPSKRQLITD